MSRKAAEAQSFRKEDLIVISLEVQSIRLRGLDQKEISQSRTSLWMGKNQDNPLASGHRYIPTLARLFVLLPALFELILFGFEGL
ncbi:MAG: hypothetical protein ACQETL_10075 [Bacteroidota bacterium]